MNEKPTIEERVTQLEVAVIQLQEAFNNLVQLAVRTKEEEETLPMRASVKQVAAPYEYGEKVTKVTKR